MVYGIGLYSMQGNRKLCAASLKDKPDVRMFHGTHQTGLLILHIAPRCWLTIFIGTIFIAREQHCTWSMKPTVHNYTERDKKLITSSERRSLKSTASELIIFGHR